MEPSPLHWLDAPVTGPYRWTMLGAITLSAIYWWRQAKKDPALLPIFIGALCGVFLGAKVAYLLGDGWWDLRWLKNPWPRLLAGKSIVGGILGGWAGVELLKWLTGYRKPTGDAFVLIAPLGIALGRVGCWLQGCCLGRPMAAHWIVKRDVNGIERWPAAQIELGFQLAAFALVLVLRKRAFWQGRVFFAYLVAYGLFRFGHEYVRDTPTLPGGLSGYQWMSGLMVVVGSVAFVKRGPATG